ncbi:hypothetical protein C922_05292 [Plasmodium inui San Antonio 1]|uniref:Uncharacterized protein n=1 Tax=Plasmodium inui San Antonio 1 TaxID=1237626 RepID=W6ZYB8_9APIC|nr:hypothetical protein C922_05292 [Plasmodium inui San Antonio 1]EUD64333.1 hypothetical protein C922_05292 [Plasmodium inui San Antonio 1]
MKARGKGGNCRRRSQRRTDNLGEKCRSRAQEGRELLTGTHRKDYRRVELGDKRSNSTRGELTEETEEETDKGNNREKIRPRESTTKMTSLHGWLEHLWEKSKRNCVRTATSDQDERKTICDYQPTGRQFPRGGVDDRWATILGPGNLMFTNTSRAAEIVCRGLEKWAASLIPDKGGGRWEQAKCDKRSLGLRGTLKGDIRCVWEAQHTKWEQITNEAVLTSSRGENRSLMICMDIVSIIWGVFRNSERKDRILNYGNSNLCQALYSKFKQWGNEEIAKEIMNFWFPAGGSGITIGGKSYKEGTHQGEQWSRTLYLPGNKVTALQCYIDSGRGKDSYETSCYWSFESQGCQAEEDTTWVRPRDEVSPP